MSCFAAAFSRLRRMARDRTGLSVRPMVTSQSLRVSLMLDLLTLCADWLRLVAGVFFVFCGAVLHADLVRRRCITSCVFSHARNTGARSASNRFAVFTLAAGQPRRQMATGGATGAHGKAAPCRLCHQSYSINVSVYVSPGFAS